MEHSPERLIRGRPAAGSQVFEDYYSRITYNDAAMVKVLTLLHDVSTGDFSYGFVDQRARDDPPPRWHGALM